MSSAITPYVAKNAAALINPVATTVFSQLVLNQLATAPAFSAYVAYNVYNTSTSATTQAAVLYGGHAENVNAAIFRVRAWGRATGGTTTNFTPGLQFGRSTTAASNTTLGTLTARSFNTLSGAWYFDATLIWDVTSGVMSGSLAGLNGSTATIDAAALVTPVTGQTAAVLAANSVPNTFFFSVTGIFSGTNANNIAYLDGFQVEDL